MGPGWGVSPSNSHAGWRGHLGQAPSLSLLGSCRDAKIGLEVVGRHEPGEPGYTAIDEAEKSASGVLEFWRSETFLFCENWENGCRIGI